MISAHHAGAGGGVLRHVAPTRLKLRDGIMSGTREALTSGRADLAIGVSNIASDVAGLQQAPLGDLRIFIYVVAPTTPGQHARPITDADVAPPGRGGGRLAQRGGMTMGLLGGQDVLTVDTMQAKVAAGAVARPGRWLLPEPMVRPYLEAGRLVGKRVARPERQVAPALCLGRPGLLTAQGRALRWWLAQARQKPRGEGPAGKPPPFLSRDRPARVYHHFEGAVRVFNVERHFRCL